MSSGEVRKISHQDVQLVQNLIEQCLTLYMSPQEVVNILSDQEKIDRDFTELVWQKLEEENQEFFKAYQLRLFVKEQIMEFNRLLARQVELMRQVGLAGVAFIPMSNGSHVPPMQLNSACYAPENTGPGLKTENLQQPITTSLPNPLANCGSSVHSCMQTAVDMSAQSRRNDVPSNLLLAQTSNVGMIQGVNGGMIKTEAGYPGSSRFIFGAEGNALEQRSAIGDASVLPFSSVEPNSLPMNETILDADTPSFGFLGQISRNFSLSDLTADFSNNCDILESCSRSPFLATETDNFFDSHGRGEGHGDNKRLGTISEGLSYEDFGSS